MSMKNCLARLLLPALLILFSVGLGCSGKKKEEKPIPEIPPGGQKDFAPKSNLAPKVQIPVQ
jgi:hypothetical protein